MFDFNQVGLSLFIIFGAVLVIIGATRLYRNSRNRGKDDKKKH